MEFERALQFAQSGDPRRAPLSRIAFYVARGWHLKFLPEPSDRIRGAPDEACDTTLKHMKPPLRKITASCAGLLAAAAGFAATPVRDFIIVELHDPKVVQLWPGKPPGDIGISAPETNRIYVSPEVGPSRIITNVSQPTLTIYSPDPERNTGTAMVICPGGGYHNLFWDIEGEQVAYWLVAHGMTGIILKYRVPERPGENPHRASPIGPQIDAQRAISMVRSRAAEWGIDPHRIGIIGFSAGGHLSVATATGFEKRKYDPVDDLDKSSCRPDFAVGCYSGYLKADDKDELWQGLHIPPDTPPVLLAHCSDDPMSPVDNSVIMYLALKRAGVPAELHIFATGGHDFGVVQDLKLASSWPDLCLNWLRSFSLLKAGAK
jgi:acetyl esterase/lipase